MTVVRGMAPPMPAATAAMETPSVPMLDDDDDALLLCSVAAGDQIAFERLARRHLDRAYTVALRLTGSRPDAEDVVQEVFLRLWQRPDAWRPGQAQFSTWLHRVVVNRCLDIKRRPRMTALDGVAEPEDPRPGAEADLVAAQRQRALTDAVADLPERQRAAIALTYAAGLKNGEAAKALEISVKALEALLVRAKRDLREALARKGWMQP